MSDGSFATTYAATTSPRSLSGMPMTALSATLGQFLHDMRVSFGKDIAGIETGGVIEVIDSSTVHTHITLIQLVEPLHFATHKGKCDLGTV